MTSFGDVIKLHHLKYVI